MWKFTLAATLPIPLLIAGAFWGGPWALTSMVYMSGVILLLDRMLALAPAGDQDDREFPASDGLSVALALGHFALLGIVLAMVSGATGIGPWAQLAVVMGAGLFMGQVSNANAHELIHRSARPLRRLGALVYVSLLFGHHTSAHPLVHHVHVATPQDPNSARLGESYWRFLPRAWMGSFRAGLRAETARHGGNVWRHPYTGYVVGGALMVTLVLALFGPWALIGYLWLTLHASSQLLLSDYVQHYGLMRRILPNGRPEPPGPRHSWDSRHRASAAMMLNAPRHSDHHAHPMRAYPNLALPEEGAWMPRSLPQMSMLALWPRKWRAEMDPRALALRDAPEG